MLNVTNQIENANVNPANVKTEISAKDQKKVDSKDAKLAEQKKVDKKLLDALNAFTLAEKAEKSLSGKKSIFKKDYNSKNKRSAIRKKLFGSDASFGLLEMYVKALKDKNIESANQIFNTISDLCKDAYIAETEFKSYNQYATDNLNDASLNILKGFINIRSLIK